MGTPQHRAPGGPPERRNGWLGFVAAAALAVTSLGGVALASTDSGDPVENPTPVAETPSPEPEASTPAAENPVPEVEKDPETPVEKPQPETPENPASTPSEEVTEDSDSPQEEVVVEQSEPQTLMATRAAGPEGTPPYVYWTVEDKDTGKLVEGATFTFQYYRSSWWGGSWTTGTNASGLADCVGTCGTASLDRDGTAGEFVLEYRGTPMSGIGSGNNRIVQGNNYRVSQASPPPGYRWVVSGDNTKTIGGNNSSTATWSGNTHNFGTFQVERIPAGANQPSCGDGYVYSLKDDGQMQQVVVTNNNATVTNFGTKASGVSSFNGLGIGSNGQPVFAYERSTAQGSGTSVSQATIWEFDTTTGTWSTTGVSVNSYANGGTVQFVAGAVSLDNGRYYIGGFSTDGTVFRIWEYNPANKNVTYKGHIDTSPGQTPTNGDMAFDSAGNLYVVRGAETTTTVFSVTKASLDGASGQLIPSSRSASFTTMSNVSGVAFDSSGKVYLGSSQLRSYDMPNWSNSKTVVSSGLGSSDLAGCSSPPTITIRKNVIGGRAKANDQFKLELKQGNQSLGTETTTGDAKGIQDKQIGPQPTVRNTTLTFTETGAGGANLATDYKSAYQCTVTHKNGTVQVLDQVPLPQTAAKTGTIVIPSTGEAVVCDFRNSPLTADVTINKLVTDWEGKNAKPASEWEIGLTSQQTSGTVTQNPTGKQTTDSEGKTSWKLTFAGSEDKAKINVSETMKPGYAFLEGSCLVTDIDGKETTVDIKGPDAAQGSIEGVAPGSEVECTYTNKPIPGSLKIVKAFDKSVPANSGNIEFTGTYTCVLGDDEDEVASGTWSKTGADEATLVPVADNLPAGAVCTVTEDALPVAPAETGLPNGSYEWGAPTITQPGAIVSGGTSTALVKNKVERVYGNFSVQKIVPEGSVVDGEMTFGGNWTCTLGNETVTGTWGPIAQGGKWTSTDANEIPLGAGCEVTSETRPVAPVENDPSYSWDGNPEFSGPVEAVTGEPNVVTVTNKTKRELGSVTWAKVDGNNKALAGSEWLLTGPNGFSMDISEAACTETASTPGEPFCTYTAVGQFKVEDLKWGEYTLKETKAPAGYVLDTTQHKFEIGQPDGETVKLVWDLGAIENTQQEVPGLPITGGRAAVLFTGIGLLILGGAGGAAFLTHRRRIS